VIGVLWLVAVIATAIASGLVAIDAAARTEARGPAAAPDQRPEGRV
jgi:hypothetical protein